MDSLLMKNVYTNIYVSRMCANILKNVSEFVNEWVGTWIKRGCLRYKVLWNLWWARVFTIIFCGNMNESDFSLAVKGSWFTVVSLVYIWPIQLVRCVSTVSSTNLSKSNSKSGVIAEASTDGTLGLEVRIILGLDILFLNSSLRDRTCSSSSLTRMVSNLFFSSSFFSSSKAPFIFFFLLSLHLWLATLLRSLIRLYLLSSVVKLEFEVPPTE